MNYSLDWDQKNEMDRAVIPMTEITPSDLRVKAETSTDPVVVRMLTEAADCIEQLRSELADERGAHEETLRHWKMAEADASYP